MRFRHAPFLLLAAASLTLVAAAPVPGTGIPTADLGGSVAASSSAAAPNAVDAYQRAGDAIVAMVSGPQRTGSALVVAPGLLVTSVQIVNLKGGQTSQIMSVQGDMVPFTVVARDKRLGLVLLSAPVDAKPVVWGSGAGLQIDDKVIALGIGSENRGVLEQKGTIKSPAFANGKDLMITDIKIDPLVEGGALVRPDGKIAGIVVAKGQGDIGGGLGWAVTSEAVQSFVKTVAAKKAEQEAAIKQRTAQRVVAWTILLAFLGLMTFAARAFRRWYKRMEAREEAAMAAEEAARLEEEDLAQLSE
jgi:hypothetical protein